MFGYKLFRVRKDGTLGSLFINKKEVLPIGEWIKSESYPTKGYKFRPYFHVLPKPHAPHLSNKGREWWKVELKLNKNVDRPESQGGTWYLADSIKILHQV